MGGGAAVAAFASRPGDRMNRRRALLVALCATVLSPLRTAAQSPERVYRIGLLGSTSRKIPAVARFYRALEQGLRDLGYVEGRNLILEYRGAEGRQERLPQLAAELVALKVDLIIASTDTAALAAKDVSRTVPIVFVAAGDPVGIGLVESLARPGGNVTGFASFTETVVGKQFELLSEVVPGMSRLAVLYGSGAAASGVQLREIKTAGTRFKLEVRLHDVRAGEAMEDAFRAIRESGPEALQVLPSVTTFLHRARIAEFARAKRLPSVYGLAENVEAGGLMSYSFSYADNFRRSALYADKILKGARPADLPVEQPVQFELVVNLRTARDIGVSIPSSVLVRADRVIE